MGYLKVYTDGASRNNPGHSGIGVIIQDENNFTLTSYKEYAGTLTNNQAEYRAILKSIEVIKKLISKQKISFERIEFYSDSELMVKQLSFEYRIKEPELALLNNKFHVEMKKLGADYTITHIERSLNKAADRLANQAIDRKLK